MEWIGSETERYLWKYYFVASLLVDMKSFIRYMLESIVNMTHFNCLCSFLSKSDAPNRTVGPGEKRT